MKYSLLILPILAAAPASAITVFTLGIDNNTQLYTPTNLGDGSGGTQVNFVQEFGPPNALPGNPNDSGGTGATRQIDDDYYFAGNYGTIQDGGSYTPVGIVAANEQNVERAFTGNDPELRFHFNIPGTVNVGDQFTLSFDFYNMDLGDSDPGTAGSQAYPRRDPSLFWNVNAQFNGATIGAFNVTDESILDDLNPGLSELTATFNVTAANLAADADNYITLSGSNAGSNSRWMSLDYVSLEANPVPEPSSMGILALALAGSLLGRRRR